MAKAAGSIDLQRDQPGQGKLTEPLSGPRRCVAVNFINSLSDEDRRRLLDKAERKHARHTPRKRHPQDMRTGHVFHRHFSDLISAGMADNRSQ